jgi:hypothetical protein
MFELISSYKGLVIALILTNGELLKIELFEDTCADFWKKHVVVHERKIKLPKQNHYYHTFQDKVVVGHQALSQGALKLYRVSSGVDPSSPISFSRSLVLVHSLPDPVPAKGWKDLQAALLQV